MADKKLSKEEQEELNKLEDEAYFELCQIIAQAMQTEDLEWLNYMVGYWKNKYKKVLDNASPSFKKKLDYLLNQFYSEAIRYILSQLKIKEEKAIKNQNKAINELYGIIKDTNDLATLKSKVKKWKEKYPYESFLKMYQRKIDTLTREKNLEENAFDQDKAFTDLYYTVINRNGTIEELKSYLTKWEETYGINKKFTIDQFIKHQSEVKRYVSEEYLTSIAKKDDKILEEAIKPIEEISSSQKEEDPKEYSSLDVQAAAYSKLLAISKDPNRVNDVFNWVYKNRAIKFNKKYKELILSATALNYSPKFLSKLEAPNINILSSSLSQEEHTNISKIKEYAIISYFNLLLPQEIAVSNKYFNHYAQKIYDNSKALEEKAKKQEVLKNLIKEEVPVTQNDEIVFDNPLEIAPMEIDLSISKKQDCLELEITKAPENPEIKEAIEANPTSEFKSPVTEEKETVKIKQEPEIEIPSLETGITIDLKEPDSKKRELEVQSPIVEEKTIEAKVEPEVQAPVIEEKIVEAKVEPEVQAPVIEEKTVEAKVEPEIQAPVIEEKIVEAKVEPEVQAPVIEEKIVEAKVEPEVQAPVIEEKTIETEVEVSEKEVENSEPLSYEEIVTVSPLFFEAIHNLEVQSQLVNMIDTSANLYVSSTSKSTTLKYNDEKEKNN